MSFVIMFHLRNYISDCHDCHHNLGMMIGTSYGYCCNCRVEMICWGIDPCDQVPNDTFVLNVWNLWETELCRCNLVNVLRYYLGIHDYLAVDHDSCMMMELDQNICDRGICDQCICSPRICDQDVWIDCNDSADLRDVI